MSAATVPSRGVLVTGASRGVGAAVARAFAENGDRVVVHHRSADSLERAAAVLKRAAGAEGVRVGHSRTVPSREITVSISTQPGRPVLRRR